MCLLSIISLFLWQGKFEIWIVAQWTRILQDEQNLVYETGITRITFILVVHRQIAEAANLCIAECKQRILFLYEYSTFYLKLLITPTLVMIEISFTSRRWCQMVLGWYVKKTKCIMCWILQVPCAFYWS